MSSEDEPATPRKYEANTQTVWIDSAPADIKLGDLRRLIAACEGLDDNADVTVDKRWGSNADRSSCWFRRIEVVQSVRTIPVRAGKA